MTISRVRVELKRDRGYDRDRALKAMIHELRKRCNEYGVLSTYKEHQYFESPSQKRRKKRKQAINRRIEEDIALKLRRGEKVDMSSKLVKKIKNRERSKKNKERYSG